MLAAAALLVTGFSLNNAAPPQKEPAAKAADHALSAPESPVEADGDFEAGHPTGAALPAVARIWASLNCHDRLPGRDLRVHEDDLLAGAARFEAIRDRKGEIAACAAARHSAAKAMPGPHWPRRIFRVSFTLQD